MSALCLFPPASKLNPYDGEYCTFVVSVSRSFWTNKPLLSFGDVSVGSLVSESVASINCLIMAAMMHNVKVSWESVYSLDVEEWEERNPGKHPGDNELLGFRIWFSGNAAEVIQMMAQVTELHAQGNETSSRQKQFLPMTAWQYSSTKAIQRLRGFSCGTHGRYALRLEVAMNDEEPFENWVEQNRGSLVAEMSFPVQKVVEKQPTHPFYKVCSFQELDHYQSSTGTLQFPQEVVDRGFVYDFGTFAQRSFPAWNLTPTGKDQQMAGLNDLFKEGSRWAMPMHQPSKEDILSAIREINNYSGGARVDEDFFSELEAYEMAPNYHLKHYHGDDYAHGDMSIGDLYAVWAGFPELLPQNMLEHQLYEVAKRVYPSQVGVSSDVRKLFAENGTPALDQCERLIRNVMRIGPGGPDPAVVQSLALCYHDYRSLDEDKFRMDPEEGLQTAHFVFDEILGYFSEAQSMTPQQAKIAVFMHFSFCTTLLPELYRLRICLEGPPASGKTRLLFKVAETIPKHLILRQDYQTSAVLRRGENFDCRLILRDEEKAPPDLNDRILEQTMLSSGTLEVAISKKKIDGNWATEVSEVMARVAVAATTNGYHNDPKYSKGGSVRTDAGESRTMTTQVKGDGDGMQKERTIDALISGACGDAIKAETKFQNDLSLAIMTRAAMIDHFYMPGKWITYNMVVFNLLLKHHGYKVTEQRQTEMMICFAISMSMKLFHVHIERLKVAGDELPYEDYFKAYVMSRYPSFEGIVIAHNMYTMLTELEEEKNRLVSHLSMLIHVTSESGILTSGELTTHGMYYQLSVQLTNHASDFKLTEKLVKALVEIGKGTGWLPGESFIKKQIQALGIERTNEQHRDPIKTEDGIWYIKKSLVDDTYSEGEQIFLRAIKEDMAIKDKDRVHPYSSGDPNGQREDQVIVPLSLVKSLFMEKACPDTAGPCVRHMHKVETMLPGSVVQTIALLKQRHAPNGLQLVRPIKGQVYDAVYETDEMVHELPETAPGFELSQARFKESAIYPGFQYRKGLTPLDNPLMIDLQLLTGFAEGQETEEISYKKVYADFFRIASSSYSDFHCFTGFDPRANGDGKTGLKVPKGPFEVKIRQISRKRSRSGQFSGRSAPKRKDYLTGGILDPAKAEIVFDEKSNIEKQCSFMAYKQAGFPPEEFEADYARLGPENLRIKAVAEAKAKLQALDAEYD